MRLLHQELAKYWLLALRLSRAIALRLRALPHQVAKYWLLARMCNDVIVHASTSGFFLYLSPECKEALGYNPNGLSDAALHQIGAL